ncbi:glutaminyl-peptide cyclotransferase [Oceanisphaera avium]|nr:glutaminyl-peptide cyclotransferase [Oceanisphaera avium]
MRQQSTSLIGYPLFITAITYGLSPLLSAHFSALTVHLRMLLVHITLLMSLTLPVLANAQLQHLDIKVLAVLAHDNKAFTQGLLFDEGYLYESTGLYGQSSLRKMDAKTGKVLLHRPLARNYFGEGLAQVGEQLIQLTWQEGKALVYDKSNFNLQRVVSYQGEGWGLCYDGEQLWMSDGSDQLQRRDRQSFSLKDTLSITLKGEPLAQLNELACVEGDIYANIWHDQRIVRINSHSGEVEAIIDASTLIAASERSSDPEAVLNGIAYDATEQVFYITGKLWPKIFKVQWQASAELDN